jgi:peptidoglycan hydrolase-like protein with peptidoglycan-binding domain
MADGDGDLVTRAAPDPLRKTPICHGEQKMALNWPLLKEGQPAPGPLALEPIRSLQYLLRHHRHGNVAVDGIFGPITAAAVRAFQQSHGLIVDGVVGNQTWPAIIVQVNRAATAMRSEASRASSGSEPVRRPVEGASSPCSRRPPRLLDAGPSSRTAC